MAHGSSANGRGNLEGFSAHSDGRTGPHSGGAIGEQHCFQPSTHTLREDQSNDPTESDKFLRLFDFPIPRGTAAKRTRNVIPQQYLFMLNSPFMVDRAKALTKRVETDFEKNTGSIDAVYSLIYGRSPSEEEIRAAQTFLGQPDGKQSDLSPWELYCQALLASNEFMYIR